MTNFKSLFIVCLFLICAQSLNAQPQIKLRIADSIAPQSHLALRELDYIVALVNSEPITKSEVQSRQARLMAQWAEQGITPPSAAEVFKRVLEQLIVEHAVMQAGKEGGLRVTDAQLNDSLMDVARQNGISGLAEFQKNFEASGGNWNAYREEIRGELLRMQTREREVDARIRISESEIDQAMQSQNLTTQSVLDLNLAQILVALPDDPSKEIVATAEQKAQQIAAQARAAGADFLKLAQQLSDAMDKNRGGVIGLRSEDKYPALFVDATRALQIGAVTDPVRSDAGFHILKVLERTAGGTLMSTQSRARHILLPITANQTQAQALARLAGFKAQIDQRNASFEALAKQYSTDGSAAQGGDLGWAAQGMFVPEFERVMNALPIGKVSEPFVSRFGVHLIEVTERRQIPVSMREQRAQVQAQLREKKTAEAAMLWMSEIRARAFVEYKNTPQ